jgi:hypothetical protein
LPTFKSASVVARWTVLPLVAVIALYIAMGVIATNVNASSEAIFYMALFGTAALFILMCVGIAPAYRRVVAVATFVVVVAFVVKFVPYPNVGLPFGYWVYPNRAIKAFLECHNVQSAKVGWAYHDLNVEEFAIDVTISETNGRTTTRWISFDQYPSRKYIVDRVATIGCQL